MEGESAVVSDLAEPSLQAGDKLRSLEGRSKRRMDGGE